MYQNYPSGFRRPLGLDRKTETLPDAELIEILEKIKTYQYRIDSWSTRAKVLQAASRLFGNFSDWLLSQDKNPDISENAYEIMADTIAFIKTGRRPISLSTRIAICATETENNIYHNSNASRRTTTLLSQVDFPMDEYLYRWINQQGGFDDMLCTVSFIFGSELRK